MKKQNNGLLKIIKRFLKPSVKVKVIVLKVFIPAIFSAGISIFLINLIKDITNKLEFGFNNDVLVLIYLFIATLIFYYVLLFFTRSWNVGILGPELRKVMYEKYIPKFIYLNNNYTEKFGTGKLVAILDKGIDSWSNLIAIIFIDLAFNLTFIVLSFIFIAFISIKYFLFFLIAFIFIFSISIFFQNKARNIRVVRKQVEIGITNRFVKILFSKFEILQNSKIFSEIDKIIVLNRKHMSCNISVHHYLILIKIITSILVDGAKVFIILMFGLGFLGNELNFGEFISLMSIIYVFSNIIDKSIALYTEFTRRFVDVEKIWDFFDEAPKTIRNKKGKEFIYSKGNIELKDLVYGYSKTNKLFKNFNLKIKGGKVTAFVGNSGSGKSTLIKLISGYLFTNKGEVLVDKQNLSKIGLASYYNNIGYLTQEPSVFDGTILENLSYAVERVLKKDEIDYIIKQSGCEFVYDLPKGLSTEIGERGVKLSGGQRQRLAIAKIFFKDPNIILLDEPTSALDSFSEEHITKAMHNLFNGRTVIVIAHRLQTVKNADDIIFFDNGKIIERGSHQDLVKKKGKYFEMLELQSGF